MFKFKQHRDNPTQVPVGNALTLVFIGVGLLATNTFINQAKSTLFAKSAVAYTEPTKEELSKMPDILSDGIIGAKDNKEKGKESGIGEMAYNLLDDFRWMVQLILLLASTLGVAFFVTAFLKLKQHKDNPTQVTVGQPLTMFAVASALILHLV